ncbi:MAG: tripartite tricarboxylate transporter substrate binding protein [Xanthobacteraceae bacterium]|jgi:tripartite-type tricarboxylate transporter receptor subunit TctC
MRRLSFAFSMILAAISSNPSNALAQDYPNRPIKLVVPFAPGGAVDVLARIIGAKLAERFGQPVVIENRAGAGGNIAADSVAKSPPDGYTMLQNTNGQAITPALYRNLPFDPINDFVPVTQLVASNLIVVASPKLPVKTLAEFIALAKAKPGSLNYGSSGIGNPLHLTMEMLKHAAGLDIVAVAYRGGDAQINVALMAGEVQAAVVPLATAVQLVQDGRLTALGVTGAKRAAVLPNVPTIAEAGVPGFASTSWQGFFAPAKTPAAIVERIQRETATVLKLPDVQSSLQAMAYEPVGSTPAEFAAFVNAETAKFARVAKDAHIPMQD